MLNIKGVSKSFIQRGKVLDMLDFEVNKGDTIAVTGPSGSGKTTLLNIIGLLDRPDSGAIYFTGKPILSYNSEESAEYRNRQVGFVFQEHLLLPHLTLLENILLPVYAKPVTREKLKSLKNYAESLMKEVGIDGLSAKYPFNVSGGEAQRAALVRSLINQPSILLADEPTGSLDSENAEIMGNLLLKINSELGISLILATHSQSLALKMSRRFSLQKGKLIPA
jgi:ABC-type lipoprotein export system ATPase subunit